MPSSRQTSDERLTFLDPPQDPDNPLFAEPTFAHVLLPSFKEIFSHPLGTNAGRHPV